MVKSYLSLITAIFIKITDKFPVRKYLYHYPNPSPYLISGRTMKLFYREGSLGAASLLSNPKRD
jgi:hypothetical protein